MSERVRVAERLDAIWNALDRALGDSDVEWFESDDEMREYAPVQWAAKEIALLMDRLSGHTPTDTPDGPES